MRVGKDGGVQHTGLLGAEEPFVLAEAGGERGKGRGGGVVEGGGVDAVVRFEDFETGGGAELGC